MYIFFYLFIFSELELEILVIVMKLNTIRESGFLSLSAKQVAC